VHGNPLIGGFRTLDAKCWLKPVKVECLLVVAVVEVNSCLPKRRREVVSLFTSIFEEVLCTVQLPLAQVEHPLANPRQLRHVVDSVSTREVAQRCSVLIVPCTSVGALRCLLDGVCRERVEDANSTDVECPSIVRI